MTGFTFMLGQKDVFVETKKKNKTQALAKQILKALDKPDAPSCIDAVLYSIRRAECDIKTVSNGRQYYEIHGDDFGGRGSFIDDGNTIIVKI